MRKIYVLDTNVLLHDPQAPLKFEDNVVVIPAVVLEEIDAKKRLQDEIGRNARHVSRLLDSLRERGRLHEGIPLDQGGLLKVELNHRSFVRLKAQFGEMTSDNRMLAVALNYHLEEQESDSPRPVIVVSKDVLVRVKADVLGLAAQDYLSDRTVTPDAFYTGYSQLYVHPGLIDTFYSERSLAAVETGRSFWPNEFVILRDETGTSKSALAKVSPDGTRLEPLRLAGDPVWGITARNAQQRMALELLLNDDIPLVTLTGRAGRARRCSRSPRRCTRWRTSAGTGSC